MQCFKIFLIVLSIHMSVSDARADESSIILQSTTSTANSGLYDHLLPIFKKETGITVHVVAVGTGQAIKNAKNCDGDVLLVHAKLAEQKFVSEGFGIARYDVMYNDFILVGPPEDPAKISGGQLATIALANIAMSQSQFASRADNSGTHKKEVSLWNAARIKPQQSSGHWYLETGSGMGATLNIAVGSGAYTMTDRATWISFKNKQDYKIQVEGDESLFNQYGIIQINPKRCPQVKSVQAKKLIDWMLSRKGRDVIAEYKLEGQQLFFPNALTHY
jgi:tungstate transport system substrate-binding protein